MKPTWKKVYHANGTTEVWPDGKKPDDWIVPIANLNPVPDFYDFLLQQENAARRFNPLNVPDLFL